MQQNSYIFEATEQNIQQILEQSRQIPVIVDFWSARSQPSQQMAPVLDRLVNEYQGKVLLARINVDEQPMLTSQFGVQSLPSLKLVFQGQLVNELDGPQTEAGLREWLAPIVDPEAAEAQQAQKEVVAVREWVQQRQEICRTLLDCAAGLRGREREICLEAAAQILAEIQDLNEAERLVDGC